MSSENRNSIIERFLTKNVADSDDPRSEAPMQTSWVTDHSTHESKRKAGLVSVDVRKKKRSLDEILEILSKSLD